MTILDINILLLIGMLCPTIQATEPGAQAVYNQWAELNMRLQQACIEQRFRDQWVLDNWK